MQITKISNIYAKFSGSKQTNSSPNLEDSAFTSGPWIFCLHPNPIPVSIDKSLPDGGISDHLEALAIQLKRSKHYNATLNTEDVANMKL